MGKTTALMSVTFLMSVGMIFLLVVMGNQGAANSKTEALLTATLEQYKAAMIKLSSAEDEVAALKKSSAQSASNLQELKAQLEDSKRISTNLRDDVTNLTGEVSRLKARVAQYEGTYGTVYQGIDPKVLRIPSNPYSMLALRRNLDAKDVTFEQLRSFIFEDDTDIYPYIYDVRMCVWYAETLFNNAQAKGIRAAIVLIDFKGMDIGHAINAFKTTDRGLVFIDDTGYYPYRPFDVIVGVNGDKITDVKIGQKYRTFPLLPAGVTPPPFMMSEPDSPEVSNMRVFW